MANINTVFADQAPGPRHSLSSNRRVAPEATALLLANNTDQLVEVANYLTNSGQLA